MQGSVTMRGFKDLYITFRDVFILDDKACQEPFYHMIENKIKVIHLSLKISIAKKPRCRRPTFVYVMLVICTIPHYDLLLLQLFCCCCWLGIYGMPNKLCSVLNERIATCVNLFVTAEEKADFRLFSA